MIQPPLDFSFPSRSEIERKLADALDAMSAAAQGMSQSAAHAESVDPGFTERAYGLLADFCKSQGTNPFTSEDFRLYAHSSGFEIAVPKALGAVFKRAAREGLIVRDGFGKAFARHGSPTIRWRAG